MVKTQIAINGCGLMSGMLFRQVIKDDQIEVIAINARYPPETLAHLIKYDSVHGIFDGNVKVKEDSLVVNGKKVSIVNSRDPEELPWKKLAIDVVIEATGKFNSREGAGLHLEAGAKKVEIGRAHV